MGKIGRWEGQVIMNFIAYAPAVPL